MTLRSVSYGGGVQSTALLVLAAQGRIDFPLFLFANVGDDSEHPATLEYVHKIAKPFAAEHGVELVELVRRRRNGVQETLKSRLDAGNIAIPARREPDGPPMSRSCTADFKVAVIGKELKRRGATKDEPAIVALGISTDEIERANPGTDARSPWQVRTYPLLPTSELDPFNTYGLDMRRSDCMNVISEAGLPVPPPSSCWFCPHHSIDTWRQMKRRTPELFEASCRIESHLTDAARDGRPVYLTRKGRPLVEVIDDQQALFEDDGCESGWCMT